jgi:geranylgeranyl pyrophosphate synthase
MPFELPQLNLPAPVPKQKLRAPQSNIPGELEHREKLKRIVQAYVAEHRPVPPMPLEELRVHAERALIAAGEDTKFIEYGAVLVNNEMWRDHLASVPYNRRLLLMPKCLRAEETCPAPFDEFGLLCKQCGQCSIQDLQEEAERMGYAVLVAEGSAIVMAIIETGKIDAIIGVSCLSVLEKAFPYMESAAIPGVAIPLLQDDCKDTNVDMEWIWDVIHLTSDDKTYRMDLDALRQQVDAFFSPAEMDRLLGPCGSETEQIARAWLAKDGKRWRPFLTVCSYQALTENFNEIPDDLKRLAIAVECLHKASLVHDDIEDGDATRYDEPTVHAEHGVPVALNVGDLLLGEGYRLIAEVSATAEQLAEMLKVAAHGHRDLCLGQGAELCWQRSPSVLKSTQVLDIFRRKTAPAFEVALQLGAIYAGAPGSIREIIHQYSEALGIAYQIRDDMQDWFNTADTNGTADVEATRPTLIPALAFEKTRGTDNELVKSLWLRQTPDAATLQRLRNIFAVAGVHERAQDLLVSYKEEAIRSLRTLENATLKGLLRRVMTKIFNDLEIKGWCREFETANAAGRQAGAESAA